MTSPETFEIAIADEALRDLHARIDNTRWPDSLEDVGWAYGMDAAYLRELVEDWRHRYDWRAQEAALNALPSLTDHTLGVTLRYVSRTPIRYLVRSSW